MIYFVEILSGYLYNGVVSYIRSDNILGIDQVIFDLANFINEHEYENEGFRDILHAYIIVELNIINEEKLTAKYKKLVLGINDIIAQYMYVLDM